ncbi:MAG TPA: serine--tRNA ligase [Candidatus Sumerlaeia bacterium]|nr:MAG: Serine--tRNA ligase [candidate division BRC1 bacterium ADurb.Bin183]HRR30499.1 serine--tRNA ligase [Candidatus Sumerlaeia bacterium]
MLDIQLIRSNPDDVKKRLRAKRVDESLVDGILNLDKRRREIQSKSDEMKKTRNERSKEIGNLVKQGQDASALKEETRLLGERIKDLDVDLKNIEEEQHQLLLTIPNMPHESVPVGESEESNAVVGEWGEKPNFHFEPKPHWEIGEKLDILDLPRATKIAGSGFPLLKGSLARLERTLISWMLDLHSREHGYVETAPPYLVNRKSMTGTGQLPKMEEDMYLCQVDDLFLIPTAEVPVTNIHADEILNGAQLPVYYVAYTPCFRREAGSHGKETRGLTRVHQFSKVELVKLVKPETSYNELETLLKNAEEVLRRLGLHYRVVALCSGDLSFSAAKCYDIEVWAPGMQKYLEVSSCSNFEDFQARRAGLKFRREAGAKPEFVHTLNGSGVALPRLMIALLETYQQPDGTVKIPDAIRGIFGADVLKN